MTALRLIAAAASIAAPLVVGDARADPFDDPRFPIYRWHPMVQHDRLSGRSTIYQPLDPAAPFLRDYGAPRVIVEPDGTIYQTRPGGGARDWSVPPVELEPMDSGFGDE
jgi:hypothetical protein